MISNLVCDEFKKHIQKIIWTFKNAYILEARGFTKIKIIIYSMAIQPLRGLGHPPSNVSLYF